MDKSKNGIILLLLLLIWPLISIASTPIEIKIGIDNIYIPKGFNSNDTAEIFLSGVLPNLCHKAPSTQIKIKKNKIKITAKTLLYEPDNPFCPRVLLPFLSTVSLGMLKAGNYEIIVNEGTPLEKRDRMKIREVSEQLIDDFIYANVSYVEITSSSLKDRTVYLNGYNPSDCLTFDRVKMISNEKNTITFLPVMKQTSEFCPMKMTPFRIAVEVPHIFDIQKYLLHVRIMDGKSVSKIWVETEEY